MTAVASYADTETLVKSWALTTDVAPLVTVGARVDIYLAMPLAAPIPSVIMSRTGGGPSRSKDLPEEVSRMSFQCWGNTRAQAGLLARTLVAELDTLARLGGWISGGTVLAAGEIVTFLWLPDPEADTPRYIVDALVTTVSA